MSQFGTSPNLPGPNSNPLEWLQQYQQNVAGPTWNQQFANNQQMLNPSGQGVPSWMPNNQQAGASINPPGTPVGTPPPFSLGEYLGGGGAFIDKQGMSENFFQFLTDLGLGHDMPLQQAAADEQYNRVNSAIGRFSSGMESSVAGIREAGTRGAEELRNLSGTIGDEPMRFATAAVEDAQEGVRRADELAGSGTQSGVAGFEQRMRNEMAMMRSGTNPDGTKMSPEQFAAVQQQIMYDAGTMSSQIRAGYEQSANSMRQALSQTQMGAAGVATETGRLSAGLMQSAAALETDTFAKAAQLEMEGRSEEAKLLMSNPKSVANLSNFFLNLWGVAAGSRPAQGPSSAERAMGIVMPIASAFTGGIAGGLFGGGGGGGG